MIIDLKGIRHIKNKENTVIGFIPVKEHVPNTILEDRTVVYALFANGTRRLESEVREGIDNGTIKFDPYIF